MDGQQFPEDLRLSALSAIHTLLEEERRATSQLHVGQAEVLSFHCGWHCRVVQVDKGLKAWIQDFDTRHATSNFVAEDHGDEASPGAVPVAEDHKSAIKAFATQFHELVHSSSAALQAVLAMEKSYGDALALLADEREATMADMQNRQSVEMEHVCMQTSLSTSVIDDGTQDPVCDANTHRIQIRCEIG